MTGILTLTGLAGPAPATAASATAASATAASATAASAASTSASTASSATAAASTDQCPVAPYRSSCAQIRNATQGFSGPGVPSVSSGFPFTFVRWLKEGTGYNAGHSSEILPGASGFAYARNTGYYVTGVEGTYVYKVGGVLANQGTREVFLHMDTPLSGSNSASCISGTYVYCEVGPEQGHSKDPSWPFTLITRPLAVRIDNFLGQPLRLESVTQANNLVRDPAGDRNVNEIPADTGGVTGVAHLGGLLSVGETAALDMTYRVLPGGTGEFDGGSVNIYIEIPLSGKSDGSRCEVATRSSSGVLRCEVQPFSVLKNQVVSARVVVR
jgi:hypothetical protein